MNDLDRARAALAVIRGFVNHCEATGGLDLPPDDKVRLERVAVGLEELVVGLG